MMLWSSSLPLIFATSEAFAMSSAENQPDSNDMPADVPEAGDQLPVYLDDEAVESMAGETMDAGRDADSGDAERLVASGVSHEKKEKYRRKGGIGWFRALFLFLFAQFLLLLMVGAVFRKPLTQVYERLVEKGFVTPGSLPWQRGGTTTGEAASSIGNVQWEDVRLRHELTLLADAAIARGDRGALDELRAMLDVAEDPMRRAAARAEMFRVQQMYATASRLPGEPLAVAQLFPGKNSEKDLTEEQIVGLMTDPDREPELKIRAASLLQGHRTMTANDKLMIVIRKEQNLDVVKQAMLSFQSNTGYQSGDWFDAHSAEIWWAENASRLAKEFSENKSDDKPIVPATEARKTAPIAPKNAPVPMPSAGEAAPALGADPPAAPAPSADGPPVKKNLRPLPSVPKEGGIVPADSAPAAAPAAPSANNNQ
jgi:hypothetical protein